MSKSQKVKITGPEWPGGAAAPTPGTAAGNIFFLLCYWEVGVSVLSPVVGGDVGHIFLRWWYWEVHPRFCRRLWPQTEVIFKYLYGGPSLSDGDCRRSLSVCRLPRH